MTGILSKKWHNKRSGWCFFPADAFDGRFELFQYTGSLHQVLIQAEQARPAMQMHGERLAHHLGGAFTLAANKTREQALISTALDDFEIPPSQLEMSAHSILDPVRGCILVDGPQGIQYARTKLRSILDFKQSAIVKVSDRYSRPPSSDLRGIFINLRMPNGVIGEMQIHTHEYWTGLNRIRAQYERYRSMLYQSYLAYASEKEADCEDAGCEDVVPVLHKAWTEADDSKIDDLRKIRTNGLRNLTSISGVKSLELSVSGYEGDCSFPMRPAVDAKTGQMGYSIPAYKQAYLVKSDFTHRRPKYY